ncbi:hypothetical protein E0F88_03715 [Dyadobacter psychrotolerans]|uniref:Uncharacterized protein n=2 Tax=Dyadobacter psychrotolerans TaxID=2541721 RepID=A0A4R5E0R0_9BACT|nr:hypothetical protein E0F88_03715 [Dyadobacter psychrotolerans]
MTSLQGGVSARTCLSLGWITLGYAAVQQWGWAVGTVAGAFGAGCFDGITRVDPSPNFNSPVVLR